MYHVVYNVVTYLHLVIEKYNVTRNWEDREFDDSGLSSQGSVTHGWSSDGSYAHLEELHCERAEDSLPRVHDTVLVGPSSLGSPHGRRPLKTSVLLTGYDAPFSSLKREACPCVVGMAAEEIGSTG